MTTFNWLRMMGDFQKERRRRFVQIQALRIEFGLARGSLERYEQGLAEPKLTAAAAMCKWMGRKLDEYVEWEVKA